MQSNFFVHKDLNHYIKYFTYSHYQEKTLSQSSLVTLRLQNHLHKKNKHQKLFSTTEGKHVNSSKNNFIAWKKHWRMYTVPLTTSNHQLVGHVVCSHLLQYIIMYLHSNPISYLLFHLFLSFYSEDEFDVIALSSAPSQVSYMAYIHREEVS